MDWSPEFASNPSLGWAFGSMQFEGFHGGLPDVMQSECSLANFPFSFGLAHHAEGCSSRIFQKS